MSTTINTVPNFTAPNFAQARHPSALPLEHLRRAALNPSGELKAPGVVFVFGACFATLCYLLISSWG